MKKPIYFSIFLSFLFSNIMLSQTQNCLNFEGSNDYIEVSNFPLIGNSDYNVEVWFYSEITSGLYNRIIGWENFELDIAVQADKLSFYDGSECFLSV